ncbi:unnamed protein product [Commensalibacter communis]|nr:unnamed protein product [Commensalibacter communis]CAI3955171.1 unnamed protein product [Commensalibacter communis]CAI3956898.1 unnamed protein product [Commensalibacter communis]
MITHYIIKDLSTLYWDSVFDEIQGQTLLYIKP